jgi:hypothetical protein
LSSINLGHNSSRRSSLKGSSVSADGYSNCSCNICNNGDNSSGEDCSGDDGGCGDSNCNSKGVSDRFEITKTIAATTMVGGTDNNQLKGVADEMMAAETAPGAEMVMVTMTTTMFTPMPTMVH